MTQIGLSGLAGCWRAVVGFYYKLVLLAEHSRLLSAADDESGWPEWAGCWRAVVGVYCKAVLMAEHWRLLSAAADDPGWPEWAG